MRRNEVGRCASNGWKQQSMESMSRFHRPIILIPHVPKSVVEILMNGTFYPKANLFDNFYIFYNLVLIYYAKLECSKRRQ